MIAVTGEHHAKRSVSAVDFKTIGAIIVFGIQIGAIIWGAATLKTTVDFMTTQIIELQKNQATIVSALSNVQINMATLNSEMNSLRIRSNNP